MPTPTLDISGPVRPAGDTSANWAAGNPVLAPREIGLELDTRRFKVGDGVTPWTSLPYFGSIGQVEGALNFQSVATPTPPASGLDLFSRNVATRRILSMIGPSGLDVALQPALFGNRVYLLSTGASTTLSFVGGPTHTAVGTVTTPALDASSLIASMAHVQIASAATANAVAHQRVAQFMCWRGDNPGFGGWFYRLRFGLKLLSATNKGLFGLHSSTSTVAGTIVPSALANFIGVGWDEGEETFSAWTSRLTTGHTRTPTDIPVTQGLLYELTTFCAPNDPNSIGWRLDVLNPGQTARAEGVFTDTANMPLSTTFLAHHAWLGNGATASACQLAFSRLYIETDF
jgi:hypothetical protein